MHYLKGCAVVCWLCPVVLHCMGGGGKCRILKASLLLQLPAGGGELLDAVGSLWRGRRDHGRRDGARQDCAGHCLPR